MMLAAIETVTKADPVRVSRRHNSDVAAQATAGKAVHAASPLKSSGRHVYNERCRHRNRPPRAGARRPDSPTIATLDIPVYHTHPAAPTNLIRHPAIDINRPIG
jgi:hypothetical protein